MTNLSRVRVGPGSLAVLEAGAGGRPLLLLHGFTGCAGRLRRPPLHPGRGGLARRRSQPAGPRREPTPPRPRPATPSTQFADDAAGAGRRPRVGTASPSSGTRWAGWSPRSSPLRAPQRLDGLVLMDTCHGQVDIDPAMAMDAVELVRAEGIDALADVLAGQADGGPLETPRPAASARPGPTWWPRASAGCGPVRRRCTRPWCVQMLGEDDRLERSRPARRADPRSRGRAGHALPGAVAAHGRGHPRGPPRGDRRRRPQPPAGGRRGVGRGPRRASWPSRLTSARPVTDRRPSRGHGGELALAPLRAAGVTELFTLSGGHIFPVSRRRREASGVRIVDVRHEQTAVFAAEGTAKLTRRPGVAALTAGPGVTNGMSAHGHGPVQRRARRRARRPGAAGPLGRRVAAGDRPRPLRGAGGQAGARRSRPPTTSPPRWPPPPPRPLTPHRGPVFLDLPLDVRLRRREGRGRRTGPAGRTRARPRGAGSGGGHPGRGPSARPSWPAATSGGAGRGRAAAAAPRRCGCRCS